MKRHLLTVLAIGFASSTFSQNVGIGTTSFTPESDALLELRSTTSGFLMPRMNLSQVSAVSGPTEGLMVYQTNGTKGFKYYDGSTWMSFGGTDDFGSHTAEANIQLDDFWLSNDGGSEGIKISNDGKVGFGENNPLYPMHLSAAGVNAGPGLTDNVLARFDQTSPARGAGIQISGHRNASNLSSFIDLMNYSNDISAEYTVSRVGGLTEDNGEKGALLLYTNSGGSSNSGLSEKVRITSEGKMGIGTTNPAAELEVDGGARITDLAGSGTRMVVADAQGDLSTQAIPSGGGFGSGTTLTIYLSNDIVNLDVSGVSILSVSADYSNYEVKGLTGGVAGQVIAIVNTDSGDEVKFKENTGTQRFRDELKVKEKEGAIIMYDGSYWYILSKH